MTDSHAHRDLQGGRARGVAIAMFVALFGTGFVAPGASASNEPEPSSGVEVISDIAYTDPVPESTRGNLLDLYLPEDTDGEPTPLVIWSSGSAWMADNGKDGAAAIAEVFNDKGFAVAGVSVRSSFQVQFPGQLHDVRAAIRWLRSNADEHNIDQDRMAIMGDSSGGWVAAIAGTTSSTDQLPGEPATDGVSSAVQAAVPFFPPVDLLRLDEQTDAQHETYDLPFDPPFVHDAPDSPASMIIGCPIQTCPEEAAQVNPLTYVTGDEPPMHIFHGTHDSVLPPGSSQTLFEGLIAAGSEATYTLVDGAGHTVSDIINADSYEVFRANPGGQIVTGQEPAPTWDNIEQFIRSAFGDAPGEAPGNSGNAPGRSGESPGNSGSAPGRSGEAPGNSGNAPGRTGEAPDNSGNAPGRTGSTSGALVLVP
ncbi:alpha/beta hydrolase [Nesterenkonia sp. NBAIMH1]|uniref:alpha/beta hydrolase n=1 Tax=Nesterenkonia sp. NBAIMH1 TaxID=2600320 RepID=UPI0011B693C1|nr:alpha/beta hydrolase [Nesterenkonia sp. NBAIMH1]